jgi:protein disulfide-isomerase
VGRVAELGSLGGGKFYMSNAQSKSPQSTLPASKPGRAKSFNFWRWFWLTFLVVSLGYAWYCFYVPFNSNIVWAGNYSSAQQQASKSGKPIILFFTGTWCIPCRIMKRNVWADKQVVALVNAGFIPVMIDLDDPAAAETLSRYQVGATPTTIIADSQGKVLEQVRGGMGKAEFLELLARWRT